MLVVAVLLAGLALDRWSVPSTYTVVAPFALALVLVGRRLNARAGAMACAGIVALFAGIVLSDGVPLVAGLTDGLALGLIGYLGWREARARDRFSDDHRQLVAEHHNLLHFLAAVAHDMRQPLTAIQGYAQFLRQSGAHAVAEQRALESIADASHRLARLTADLADASAVGSGHFALKTGPVDLTALLRRMTDDYQATTALHQLVLNGPEQLIGIWDADRLRQLFGNLIGNAIKYAPQGGEVRIHVYVGEGEVAVTVADKGVGIAPEQMDALFQPFSRLRATDAVGTGLGLYISLGIAQAHGGVISVDSEPGVGSAFRVALPLVSGPARRREPRPHRARRPAPARVSHPLTRRRPLDLAAEPVSGALADDMAGRRRAGETGMRLPAS